MKTPSGLNSQRIFLSIALVWLVQIITASVDAHADTAFSNLGQTPVGSLAIANNSWRAERFFTGTNTGGYLLESIQLQLGTPIGTPAGFSLGIYDRNGLAGSTPGNLLQSLSGPEPSANGVFTFQSTTGLFLNPNSGYFIVATATTSLASGSFQWDTTSWIDQGNVFDFRASGLLFESSDGQTWTYSRPNNFVFAVTGTAIPEPSSLALLGLGGSFLFTRLARKSRSRVLRQPLNESPCSTAESPVFNHRHERAKTLQLRKT